jgi:hypothetical protein
MPTRALVSLSLLLINAGCASAQAIPPSDPPRDVRAWVPERMQLRGAQPDTSWHVVAGERHGVSFFRQHRFPEVEYEAGDVLTFDRYHTADVMNEWMRRWAQRYPGLVDLYEVGRSFEGRPIYQVTLTNKETGSFLEKPAAFFEGGRHSGEITSSESILWLLRHLLEGYGSDAEITRLLDTKTLYIRPQNNPDGSNLYLRTAQSNRSSVRPHDTDRDGLVDEDPPEDLDGDGIIYSLRWRVREGEEGNAVLDPRDPSGRLMKGARAGNSDWRMVGEGIDNDGDGRVNEDGIGGLDLHRNYVENWRPEPGREATGRGETQFGAGAYPLSEPETRSVVLWLLTHPHVSVANSMDTRVPMHLRPPSTSASAERMYPEDLAYYEYFDRLGLSITGYPWAGDVYETYATRYPTNDEGEPNLPQPLFGHGPDFGYWYYGSIWYGDELWNGGAMEDYNGDGLRDGVDGLIWDDRENGGRGFREWEPFEHPDFGSVEIGGFHPKFFSQNGPPSELEHWVSRQALYNLEMAKHLPQLRIDEVDVRRMGQSGDSATYRVAVRWTNTGRLPTALRQAQLVKIVTEDQVELEFDGGVAEGDTARVWISTPSTRDKTVRSGWTEPGQSGEAVFEIVVRGAAPVEGTVHLRSTRGGHLRAPLRIGG